eukprot:gene13977-biopygen12606
MHSNNSNRVDPATNISEGTCPLQNPCKTLAHGDWVTCAVHVAQIAGSFFLCEERCGGRAQQLCVCWLWWWWEGGEGAQQLRDGSTEMQPGFGQPLKNRRLMPRLIGN